MPPANVQEAVNAALVQGRSRGPTVGTWDGRCGQLLPGRAGAGCSLPHAPLTQLSPLPQLLGLPVQTEWPRPCSLPGWSGPRAQESHHWQAEAKKVKTK